MYAVSREQLTTERARTGTGETDLRDLAPNGGFPGAGSTSNCLLSREWGARSQPEALGPDHAAARHPDPEGSSPIWHKIKLRNPTPPTPVGRARPRGGGLPWSCLNLPSSWL